MSGRPIVWTIAGSDSGGGAGIQADLKTMNALDVHGCSVITALTAQNTTQVSGVEYPSPGFLNAQLEALAADLPPTAIKLGMLGNAESIRIIAKTLSSLNCPIICDPVMVSSSGHMLLEQDAIPAMIDRLFPQVHLLTPNLTEAALLTGRTLNTTEDIELAAQDLLSKGVPSVLIKGGHANGNGHGSDNFSQDYWTNGHEHAWLTSPRQSSRHTHGTGCTLSAAIAACLGLGFDDRDALVIAKAYVNQGIRNAPHVGAGNGPLAHLGWPEAYEDMPWLTSNQEAAIERLHFLDCGETPLGFYPIVNRLAWLEQLLPLGVSTIQLRIKDLSGEDLEREIAQAAALAKQYQCRLFINDYWELAIKYDAYGVHLGQEDLNDADLRAIHQAGLRLGISTHCYSEVARALAVHPSYLAIGPIFPTTTKAMRFAPQGLEAARRWRRTLPYPLVAIAGIFLENAQAVLETGVDGIAVVRDIVNSPDVPAQVHRWLNLFEEKNAAKPFSLC